MNITWSEAKDSKDPASLKVLEHWDGGNTNIYVTLVIFIVLKVCSSTPFESRMFFVFFVLFCFVCREVPNFAFSDLEAGKCLLAFYIAHCSTLPVPKLVRRLSSEHLSGFPFLCSGRVLAYSYFQSKT